MRYQFPIVYDEETNSPSLSATQSDGLVFLRLSEPHVKEIVKRAGEDRWIPVSERLPEDWSKSKVLPCTYLVWTKIGDYRLAGWRPDGNWWEDHTVVVREYEGTLGEDRHVVTHWMPLPEPPA